MIGIIKKYRYQRGFTLVELLVVIAIIGVLAAVITPNVFKAIEKSKIARTVADLKAIKSAALAYYADTGQFPPNDDEYNLSYTKGKRGIDFLKNKSNVDGWNGPYLEKWPQTQYWAGSHGGTYQWQGCYKDFNGDGQNDPCVELNFGGSGFSDDQIAAIVQDIDTALDDGNLKTGMFRYRPDNTWPQHCAYYCVAFK